MSLIECEYIGDDDEPIIYTLLVREGLNHVLTAWVQHRIKRLNNVFFVFKILSLLHLLVAVLCSGYRHGYNQEGVYNATTYIRTIIYMYITPKPLITLP